MRPAFSFLLVASAATASSWLIWNRLAHGVENQVQFSVAAVPGNADGCANATEADLSFAWDSLAPAQKLTWKLCYVTFQCARLLVPLDYSEPDGKQAAIALIRKPALIPRHSSLYKGPVLFNPGGPGGSGVDLVLSLGVAFSTVLGPQFDIVGFDPRGIARSTPKANFFATDVDRALFDSNGGRNLPVFRNDTLEEQLISPRAVARLIGSLAAKHDDGYLKHINTANTATDMLRIAQAHGREKLQYWGFSYGSILGATFAAMYPYYIERLVIDGVMDSEDYYAMGWLTNLVDTEKTLDTFFENCADAGPQSCAFHAPEPEDIRQNLTTLYKKLRAEPIPIQTNLGYGIVDESTLRLVIFGSLYSPQAVWPAVANALKQLADGDASGILSLITQAPYRCSCDPQAHESDSVWDAQVAIACNDGDEVPSSLDDVTKYFEKLAEVADWADVWGGIHLRCVGWPNSKKEFRGPFVGNTSFPILVVGNTADPVTPLRSAKKMAKGFEGAVVLTQDSPGHCSINNPSLCTQRHIQKYFRDGTLPAADTVCQPINSNPFKRLPERPRRGGGAQVPLHVSDEDVDLWDAVLEISDKFKPTLHPLSIK